VRELINIEEVAYFNIDEFSHRLYLLTNQNTLFCFGYSQLLPANTCKLKYKAKINANMSATVVTMDYIQELTSLVIAYSNGDVFTYSNQSESEGKSTT